MHEEIVQIESVLSQGRPDSSTSQASGDVLLVSSDSVEGAIQFAVCRSPSNYKGWLKRRPDLERSFGDQIFEMPEDQPKPKDIWVGLDTEAYSQDKPASIGIVIISKNPFGAKDDTPLIIATAKFACTYKEGVFDPSTEEFFSRSQMMRDRRDMLLCDSACIKTESDDKAAFSRFYAYFRDFIIRFGNPEWTVMSDNPVFDQGFIDAAANGVYVTNDKGLNFHGDGSWNQAAFNPDCVYRDKLWEYKAAGGNITQTQWGLARQVMAVFGLPELANPIPHHPITDALQMVLQYELYSFIRHSAGNFFDPLSTTRSDFEKYLLNNVHLPMYHRYYRILNDIAVLIEEEDTTIRVLPRDGKPPSAESYYRIVCSWIDKYPTEFIAYKAQSMEILADAQKLCDAEEGTATITNDTVTGIPLVYDPFVLVEE